MVGSSTLRIATFVASIAFLVFGQDDPLRGLESSAFRYEVDEECVAGGSQSPGFDDSDGLSLLHFRAQDKTKLAPFSLPFAYSILGPGGSLVARLILPLTESCPEELVLSQCLGRRKRVPVTVHAEPTVGHSLFSVNGKTFDSMNGLNLSISSPHPAFNFADRVCEARVEAAVASKLKGAYFQVSSGSIMSVPVPPANPTKYVVVGDTGLRIKIKNDGWCKKDMGKPATLHHGKTCTPEDFMDAYDPKKVDGMFQSGGDSLNPALNEWPFNKVAAAASREVQNAGGKAVIVHVGDFTYRHEACPLPFPKELTADQQEQQRTFGDCTAVGAKWGDTSEGWAADFFEPAAPLLQAAPWMVFRGNHETCNRGGAGWFRYLDPRPADSSTFPGASSAYPWCVTETPPYSVDFENDQWLVIDSADVTDEDVGIDDFPQKAFTAEDAKEFAKTAVVPIGADCESATSGQDELWMVSGLMKLVHPGKRHWIGVHRPVFGLSYESENDKPSQLYAFQCELVNAVANASIVVEDVPAIVSGHVHYFQLVQYETRTAQIAFGNSGTQLKTPLNGQPIGLDLVAGKGITVLGEEVQNSPTVGQFGYGVLAAGAARSAPTMTAKFLSDASHTGLRDITASLPLRTFSAPGSGWRSADAAAR